MRAGHQVYGQLGLLAFVMVADLVNPLPELEDIMLMSELLGQAPWARGKPVDPPDGRADAISGSYSQHK